jgi:hypothetical protein
MSARVPAANAHGTAFGRLTYKSYASSSNGQGVVEKQCRRPMSQRSSKLFFTHGRSFKINSENSNRIKLQRPDRNCHSGSRVAEGHMASSSPSNSGCLIESAFARLNWCILETQSPSGPNHGTRTQFQEHSFCVKELGRVGDVGDSNGRRGSDPAIMFFRADDWSLSHRPDPSPVAARGDSNSSSSFNHRIDALANKPLLMTRGGRKADGLNLEVCALDWSAAQTTKAPGFSRLPPTHPGSGAMYGSQLSVDPERPSRSQAEASP